MKTIGTLLIAVVAVMAASCESRTYDDVSATVTDPTYTANVKPIMTGNCTSCHSVDGGQEPYLETYDQVRNAVIEDDLLEEISAPSGDGMPESGRMPQSKINIVTTWAENGFPN